MFIFSLQVPLIADYSTSARPLDMAIHIQSFSIPPLPIAYDCNIQTGVHSDSRVLTFEAHHHLCPFAKAVQVDC
jgi:hypothetical protein